MNTFTYRNKPTRLSSISASDQAHHTTAIIDWQLSMHPNLWNPPTDVFETETKLVARVEIAGMNEEDFSVRIDQNHMVISGIRLETPEQRAFHQMEIHYGEFCSEVDLPDLLDFNKVEAEYRDGFLVVTIQKALPTHVNISE
jgi:HSP20 family molecular chaperone IbpA